MKNADNAHTKKNQSIKEGDMFVFVIDGRDVHATAAEVAKSRHAAAESDRLLSKAKAARAALDDFRRSVAKGGR